MTMTEPTTDLKDGRVVGIAGPVIDVEFPPNSLPELNSAVQFEIEIEGETKLARYKPQRAGVATATSETFEVAGVDAVLSVVFEGVRGSPRVCALEIERVTRNP